VQAARYGKRLLWHKAKPHPGMARLWKELPLTPRSFYWPERASLKVIYLLEDMVLAGGVHSVVQLVEALQRLGVAARIAYSSRSFETMTWELKEPALYFPNRARMLADLPACDVVVATFWKTASLARDLLRAGRARSAAYYVQDFEPWFYPARARHLREQALASYRLIEHRIVKSQWLLSLLAEHGFQAEKIPFGLDLNVFRPLLRPEDKAENQETSEEISILAMARPETKRRGFSLLQNALQIAHSRGLRARITLFGSEGLVEADLPFPFKNRGVLSSQEEVAELYNSHQIFLETSEFQGFGRTTMEAMACGCCCLITDQGGVSEYARNLENCLTSPADDPEAFAEKLLQLCDDAPLRQRLADKAKQTARSFDLQQEARATKAFLEQLVR
jgi:glycosyltransferase involved in cell wall biosynthesis